MAAPVAFYARPVIVRGEQCTRGALLAPTKAGRERRVVADIAKLSIGREEYYTRELATDHEQYLSGHGESPGRWYGAGASSLGLQGEASVAGFQAMFEGRDPTTGELLGRPHGRNAVPAFDVVLRPTKSVSILYGLGDSATGRAVLAAHHAGLAEAVGYLDEHLGARRGHSGVQHVSGQGLLAVGFDHRTSREGDPPTTRSTPAARPSTGWRPVLPKTAGPWWSAGPTMRGPPTLCRPSSTSVRGSMSMAAGPTSGQDAVCLQPKRPAPVPHRRTP